MAAKETGGWIIRGVKHKACGPDVVPETPLFGP